MRSTRNWSRSEKLGALVILSGCLLWLTLATRQDIPRQAMKEVPSGHTTMAHTFHTTTTESPVATIPSSAPILWAHVKPVGVASSDDSGIDPNTCTYHRDGDWWEYHSMFFGHLRECEDERSKDLSRRSGAVPAVDQMPPCDSRIVNKKIWYGYIELTCQKVWFPHEATPTYAWRPEVGLPCDAKHEGSGIVVRSGDDSDWAKIQCTHTPDGDYGWVTIDEKVLAQCLPDGSMPPGERACTDAPVEGTDRKKLSKPNFHPDPNSVWI